MKIYNKYVKNNFSSLSGKKVIITGGTGGIAYYINIYLLTLSATIILAVRNVVRGNEMKERLLKSFPEASIYVEYIDMAKFKTIDDFMDRIKTYGSIDYLINNAGIYHLKPIKNESGMEIHFATNYYGHYLLTKKMLPILNESSGKVVAVGSISYYFVDLDLKDIYSENVKNKTKIYSITKKFLMAEMLYFKNNLKSVYPNVRFDICQPGITASNLFDSRHGGFSKTFGKILLPLMHLIFFAPSKAALPIIYALFNSTDSFHWIGPGGLFHAWGYPRVNKLHSSIVDNALQISVNEVTEGIELDD